MVARDNSIYNKSSPSGHSILKKRNPRSSSIHSPIFMHTHTLNDTNIHTNTSTRQPRKISLPLAFYSTLSSASHCIVVHFVLFSILYLHLVYSVHIHIHRMHTKHISFIPEKIHRASVPKVFVSVYEWMEAQTKSHVENAWRVCVFVCACLCISIA